MTIIRADDLPRAALGPLLRESAAQGFRFLDRLVREWEAGTHRFDGPGESLLLSWCGERLVGLCGVHRDPYQSDGAVARLRHLYVIEPKRRRGVGRRLVQEAVSTARQRFRRIRVRTDTDAADAFYLALGFHRVEGEASATHVLALTGLADEESTQR